MGAEGTAGGHREQLLGVLDDRFGPDLRSRSQGALMEGHLAVGRGPLLAEGPARICRAPFTWKPVYRWCV